jgi:FSR family fosmidomycin resistance protein-like MFS transporter
MRESPEPESEKPPGTQRSTLGIRRVLRGASVFVFTLLAIELLDELVFGVREAAWPLIQRDLGLTYAQIGVLLSLPNFLANFIEPFLGILGDVWRRRALVLGGGVFFGLALLLTALSNDYWVLLIAMIVLSPASGAFVSLSQATLMDTEPARHEHNMARWTFAGSLGAVGGTLLVSVAAFLGADWRVLFLCMAGLTAVLLLVVRRFNFPRPSDEVGEDVAGFVGGIKGALRALRRREVLRWLVLLEFSDLMLDILFGFLALYFANEVGVAPEIAALSVTLWLVVGLVGDFLLIPLLERVRGLSYLRLSAALMLVLYPAFLLVPDYGMKLVLLGFIGLFNAGWYAILKGNLYSSMPGKSGTVMAVGNVGGLIGSLIPLVIGLLAQGVGLGPTMWVLLLGPIALVIGIPRVKRDA